MNGGEGASKRDTSQEITNKNELGMFFYRFKMNRSRTFFKILKFIYTVNRCCQ